VESGSFSHKAEDARDRGPPWRRDERPRIFCRQFFGYDDAIYATLRLLEIMGKDGRPLSEFLKDLPKMYSHAGVRIDCPDTFKFDVVRQLTELLQGAIEVIDTDGCGSF